MRINWKSIILAAAAAVVFSGSWAIADYALTAGAGTTIFSFTCFTSKVCPAGVQVNSAGTEIFTTGAPAQVGAPSGAFASGSFASGSMVDLGAQADTACATDNGTCTEIALLKRTNQRLTTINTTLGTPATAANQATEIASLATIATNTGAAIPAGTARIGYTSDDPCTSATKINAPISFQTTTLTQQIAASGSTKIYICSMSFIASAVTVFSVVGGTGSNCASNQLAILGTVSATHGLSLAANGGMTYGSGSGTVAVTAASSEICLVQSGSGDLSGNISYVQQ